MVGSFSPMIMPTDFTPFSMNDPKSITVLTDLLYNIVTSEIIDDSHDQLVLRLTPLPRRALVVDAVVDEHSRSPHQEGTEGLEQVADHRVGVLHVSATPHAHQRDAHRAEVEHQQHHHGENVQNEDRHAVLATAQLLRQHLPQIQAIDEVLVQTASLLSG